MRDAMTLTESLDEHILRAIAEEEGFDLDACREDGEERTLWWVGKVALIRRQLLAELDADGWQVVPKEPTDDMDSAGKDGERDARRMSAVGGMTIEASLAYEYRIPRGVYRAMLAAAPKITDENEEG